MSVVVTGATGQLGRLAVEALIARGTAPGAITAAGRNADRLAEIEEAGVATARIDFDDPDTLEEAFRGADALLLVSGSEVGAREPQHRNAIEAARKAGVGHIVYTSVVKAGETTLILAPEHALTEEMLAASGVLHTVLRNGWYSELFGAELQQAEQSGSFVGSAGKGEVAAACRTDLAEAAAAVLVDPAPHAGAVYELTGDLAWTNDEVAAELTELLGRPVEYRDLPAEEHAEALMDAGLDDGTVRFLVDLDRNKLDGELALVTGDLSWLLGRPATTLSETLRSLYRDGTAQ